MKNGARGDQAATSPPTAGPLIPPSTINWTKDAENPASVLLTATIATPAAIVQCSPNLSTSRPDGSAPAIRISANALITLAAAAVLTPNCRANGGMPGATIP